MRDWIAVPSRGRAGTSATLRDLEGTANVLCAVPQAEVEQYLDAYPWATVAGTPKDGIGNVRQAILEIARLAEWGPYWMLDDDITGVYERQAGGKMAKASLPALLYHMEAELLETGAITEGVGKIALAGPNFRHRAWNGDDRQTDVHLRNFVWVNPAAPINYWPLLKEDLDVVLQALAAGWHTRRWNLYAFDSPQMGTSQGGCRDDYDAGKLDEACKALAEKWPGVVSLKLDMDTGRLTNRVDWRAARQKVAAR